MTTTVKDFQRFVVPYIAGAPIPAVHDEIMGAAIEFCRRTRVFTEWIEVNLTEHVGKYTITPAAQNVQVTETLSAWTSAGKLYPATRPELDVWYPGGWMDLETDAIDGIARYHCPLPDTIHIVPAPSFTQASALKLEVALSPMPTSTELPDILLNRYWQIIRNGALGRLHQHPEKYADPSRAAAYLELFNSEVNRLTDEPVHGYNRNVLRVQIED